jgi:ubiquitin-protein ligase
LTLPPGVKLIFPDESVVTKFYFKIAGLGKWAGGTYYVYFDVPKDYPYSPPECLWNHSMKPDTGGVAPIYHPNIDLKGKICLNVLNIDKEHGWKAHLGI